MRRIKTEVDLYYNGDNETKLTDLTSVRQGRDESIQEYFKKFKDIKNRCFNLSLSEKDLVDLALAGLRSSYREKLDGLSFYSINQLQAKALLTFLSAITRNGVVKPIPGNGARNAC